MRQKKLRRKIGIAMMVVILALAVFFGIFSYRSNRNYYVEDYENEILTCAQMTAEIIDGDRIEIYTDSLQTDAYYDVVQDYISAMMRCFNLVYLNVFVPSGDERVYLWDGSGDFLPGATDSITEAEKDFIQAAFSKDPQFDFFEESGKSGYTISIFYPVYEGSGEPAALVGAGISLEEVSFAVFYWALYTFFMFFIMVIFILLILFWFLRVSVLRPIQILNDAVSNMADPENIRGADGFKIDIHTGDEMENLAHTFENTYAELREYVGQLATATAERERVATELSVATNIQADMLPRVFPAFPERTEFDLFASMNPAKEVGGDFYDFFLVDDNHLALVIADVSDKGVPAALFMVVAKTIIKNLAQTGLSPAEVFARANNQLVEGNEVGMFVTVWMGIFTVSDGTLVCANAGHEFPAVCRKGGKFELFKDKHNLVLGSMPDMPYQNYEMRLMPGDMLFVYTDGVTEATNGSQELFGTDRMLDALSEAFSGEDEVNCETLLQSVNTRVNDFVVDAPQFDDMTMLAFKFNG